MARREPCNPWIGRVCACAAVGVLLTIATSWVIALTVEPRPGEWSAPSGVGEGWSYWVGRKFGTIAVSRHKAYFHVEDPMREPYLSRRRREVPEWSAVLTPPAPGERDAGYVEIARGWPTVALMSQIERTIPPNAADEDSVRWGVRVRDNRGRPGAALDSTVLPLRPIWSGLAINSLFFAAMVFGVAYLPGIVRRARRRSAGRCASCGYDLRGSSGDQCPECGAARTNAAAMRG